MKTLVAVIAYNEELNIAATLQDLQRHNFGYDIAVIDNASSDSTALICRSLGVRVISHCINSGGAMGTVTSYFRYASEEGYDCLCQFDGDGQHLATELPKICAPVHSNEADYVIGSRFLEGKGFQSTFARRAGIRLFSVLTTAIMHQRVTDVTSGCRCYGRKVIEFFARNYPFELHDTNQLLLASFFSGARIKEVPVQMRERVHGVSEFDLVASLSYPFLGVVNILGVWLQRKQIRAANK